MYTIFGSIPRQSENPVMTNKNRVQETLKGLAPGSTGTETGKGDRIKSLKGRRHDNKHRYKHIYTPQQSV